MCIIEFISYFTIIVIICLDFCLIMVLTLSGLESQLADEKFGGQAPKWEIGTWGSNREISVKVAQDRDNYYYLTRFSIVVQRKNGETNLRLPYCYGCESTVNVLRSVVPVWDGPFPCSGSGRTESKYTFYCKKCDGEPRMGQLLDL